MNNTHSSCAFCLLSAPLPTKRARSPALSRTAVSAAAEPPASEAFARDARALLSGEVAGGARAVMAQDLAKRVPDALDDALRRRGLAGVADFTRQLREDLLPELGRAPELARRARAPPMPSNMPEFTLNDIAAEVRNVFAEIPEGLYSPPYETLASRDGYELRRYDDMLCARVAMQPDDSTEVSNVSAMGSAFASLADYLFGGNVQKKKMAMTTPVFMEKGGDEAMLFVLDGAAATPNDGSDVQVVSVPGDTVYAVVPFSGYATIGELRRQRSKLRQSLSRDSIEIVDEDAYKCVIYNGPTTLPFRRKQELLVPVVYEIPQPEVPRVEAEVVPETDEA